MVIMVVAYCLSDVCRMKTHWSGSIQVQMPFIAGEAGVVIGIGKDRGVGKPQIQPM